ncbi:MAG: serine/threonine-protein kinase [Planctomycetota bacterium]
MHPEEVGPYRIERRLGAGGMGNVYLGVHCVTGLQAAVKVLPASIAREDGFAERFSREIQVLRQLSNRHVVALYQDGITADGSLYYAMEYVDGPTLTAEIQSRRRLPWREVLELALQAAMALKAAHAAGVIHRDLKPSNLMLTSDRTLKLADFGVASLFAATRLTQTGSVVGTAEYMSPEQARGQRATPRSDLYSLGAVLYAMLTGRPPFSGSTTGEILQKHQFSQFDRPARFVPAIPRLLDELVCQLLDKDPAKRPADALVLIRRLEQIRVRIDQAEELQESETPLRPASALTDADSPQTEKTKPAGAAVPPRKPKTNQTPVRRLTSLTALFDNVYVLVALLGLLITAAVWMVQRSTPGDQQLLQSAAGLLDQPAGPGWIKARDEYLLPLLARQPSADQQELLRSWIQQVDDYEFTRSLQPDRRRGAAEDDELQRLIRRAFERQRRGETAIAEKELAAILVLLPTVRPAGHLEPFLRKTLQDWRQSQSQDGGARFLQQLLKTILEQHPTGPPGETARQQLKAARDLYEDSPAAAEEVRQIEQILNRS